MDGENIQPAQSSYSVFISYAHDDDDDADVSKRWLHRLRVQLSPIVRQNQVCIWSDKDIGIGDDWHDKIRAALQSARAAVLMIGPQFLASEYITNVELPILLEKAERENLLILPIILRPCMWQETRFKYPDPKAGPKESTLARFQMANQASTPLNSMEEHEQDTTFLSVAMKLQRVVQMPEGEGGGPGDAGVGVNVTRDRVQHVGGALDLLSDLVKDSPTVREAVQRFRYDFEAASGQIELLSAYKDLHDWLHTLQFQSCDLISAELALFPDDESSRARLMEPELTLQDTVDAIREQDARWRAFEIKVELMLADLDAALAELQAAVAGSEQRRLRRAASALSRVLNSYPAQINARLLEAARGLRLPGLVKAMTDIESRLTGLNVDPRQLEQFVAGVEALTQLNAQLRELLYEHDHWQTTDSEMRLLNVNSEDFSDDMLDSWPRLKVLTEVLYSKNTEPWALRFKTDSERLDEALKGQSASLIKECFRRYRRSAGIRFFKVDVKLKELCSSLQEAAGPLDRVLRMLDADNG